MEMATATIKVKQRMMLVRGAEYTKLVIEFRLFGAMMDGCQACPIWTRNIIKKLMSSVSND